MVSSCPSADCEPCWFDVDVSGWELGQAPRARTVQAPNQACLTNCHTPCCSVIFLVDAVKHPIMQSNISRCSQTHVYKGGDCRWDSGTVALVTGSNKGIGYQVARLFAEQGLSVVITARNPDLGNAAVAQLKQAVPEATARFYQLDITDANSVSACAAQVEKDFGKLDILVNNAGFSYKGNTFGADEAASTLACNLTGTRQVSEAMLPLIKAAGGGRIVNVCSRYVRAMGSACTVAAWHCLLPTISMADTNSALTASYNMLPGALMVAACCAGRACCESCGRRRCGMALCSPPMPTPLRRSPPALSPPFAPVTTPTSAGQTPCTASPNSPRSRTRGGLLAPSPTRCASRACMRCTTCFGVSRVEHL